DFRRNHWVFRIGDDRRTPEEVRDVRDFGLLQSELGKAVLGDFDLSASLLDLHAQVGKGSDGEAGVLGYDDRPSATKGSLERRDELSLFRSFHYSLHELAAGRTGGHCQMPFPIHRIRRL